MKKLFLLLITCCLSLTLSAKVAYLVPGNSNDKGEIPVQWIPENSTENHTFEHTAYDWFKTEYVDKGLGDFVNFTNIPSNKDTYSAIWIYIDREWKQSGEPWDEGRMDALFNNDVVNALKTYVQNGGNLFLGKQAARLAYRMDRIGYAPAYACDGYSQDNRFWGIKAKLGSGLSAENQRDRSGHAIYSGLATARMDNVDGCFPLLNSQGKAHSTNSNINWVEYWTPNGSGGWHKNPDDNGNPALIDGWESHWNARALGTLTHIGDYCHIMAVEFLPKDAFTGKILAMGIASYQWNSESTGDAADNVKKLTKNALYYLTGTEVIWTQTPGDAAVMEYKDAAHAVCNVDGAVVRYRSLDTDVIEIDENTGALTYKAPAPDGVVVEAYVNVGGVGYKAQHTVHVFAPLADWVVRPSKTDVKVGEDIEIDGKVRYGAATFGFKVDNNYCDCTYNEETKKYTLHFKHAGTTTVRPIATAYGVDYENNETGGEPITFTISPDLKWTTEPMSAFVGEPNKKAIASTNEGSIVYSSSDDTKVSVDSEGNLTFLGYDEADKVTITATVTINNVEYKISGEVNANLPNVMWTTEPEANAYVGQTMDIAAQLQYWTDHAVLFETTNCTYDSETKKLTITGENATVQPYVLLTAANKRYNGVLKNITVTTPVVTWAKDDGDHDMVPEDAAILEESYKRTPKAVCNIDELTVKYRSADPDKISIDETTGALQYLAPTEGDGIDITAYVTLNGVEYSISHKTKCLKPSVEWVTEPFATGVVGLDMAYAAKVKYGAATIGYDYTNCTVVDGKLHFAAAGTAIVRPYASAYDKKYYDDNVLDFNITVAEPTFTWVTDPSHAAVTEVKPAVEITVNNGMTVLYKSSNENVATVAADGKLTYRHAGTTNIYGYVVVGETTYESEKKAANVSGMTVNWTTEPTATAKVGDEMAIAAAPVYGSAVAKFVTNVNCSYDAVTKKLKFLHAGVATVQPYVEGYDDEKFYGEEKTITISPDLKWTTEPQSGCVGETGKTAIASTNDGSVVYSSSDDTKVSVDQSGNLTFHAIDVATTVTIYATVTLNEKEYQISGPVNAGLPNVYWVNEKKPGETYRLDETPAAEAKLQYGPAEVKYEQSNCTWANDKLTFTAVGEATVQPYVEYDEHKYYGEKVTIAVTPSHEVYTRPTTPGMYGTICLERTSTALEGATFYEPSGLIKENNKIIAVELVEVDKILAGYGYFFLADASQISVTMSLADKALEAPLIHGQNDADTHGMHGVFYGTLEVPANENELVVYNNQLWWGEGVTVSDHRAYIKLSEVPAAQPQAPGRRYVTMAVNQPTVATGLENIMGAENAQKVLIDGQIFILRAGQIYTTTGQLVK